MEATFIFLLAISHLVVVATAMRKTSYKHNGRAISSIRSMYSWRVRSDKSSSIKTRSPTVPEGKFHTKQFKLCTGSGPCKMKKLACSKTCRTPLVVIPTNHFCFNLCFRLQRVQGLLQTSPLALCWIYSMNHGPSVLETWNMNVRPANFFASIPTLAAWKSDNRTCSLPSQYKFKLNKELSFEVKKKLGINNISFISLYLFRKAESDQLAHAGNSVYSLTNKTKRCTYKEIEKIHWSE